MKRILLTALILCATVNAGNCANSSFFPPLQPPVSQNTDVQNTLSSVGGNNFTNQDAYNNLNQIEQMLFGRSYIRQNINSRLSRIEKALFFTTYPNSSTTQRIDNIISNFNQINKNPNISRNSLSKLESKIFNQNFPQNSAQTRIERLEQQIFGAEQSGDLDARLKALQLAAKNYNNSNVADEFSNSAFSKSNSGWKSLLGNNLGTMTGFTPNINPYSTYNYSGYSPYNAYNPYQNYNNYIGNQGYNQSIRTNRGYRDVFRGYGTGAGVTILN